MSDCHYYHRELDIDLTFAEPQAATHLQRGYATIDGIAATILKAPKRARYACSRLAPFDWRSLKTINMAVESFARQGRNDEELLEQVATSVTGGEEEGGGTRKGVLMECLIQVLIGYRAGDHLQDEFSGIDSYCVKA